MTDSALQILFVLFAFLIQVLLFFNFAARNWKTSLERKYGWLIYALGILAVILGVLYFLAGQPWYIMAAPFVYALWAALGYYVDIVKQIEWRSPPRWSIFIPYVALFIAAQFFFWIPLWYVDLTLWIIYGVLYFVNMGLNINSHRRSKGQENSVS